MNIGSLLPRHARYRPNHTAIVFNDTRLTFLQFNQRVNRLANALLGLGVGKGDKLATILPNCLELLEVYWAIAKMGAVPVYFVGVGEQADDLRPFVPEVFVDALLARDGT